MSVKVGWHELETSWTVILPHILSVIWLNYSPRPTVSIQSWTDCYRLVTNLVPIQESYPILPEPGKIELSFYNGLSDSCDMKPINLKFRNPETGNSMETFIIDFRNYTMYSESPARNRKYVVVSSQFPDSVFTIEPFEVDCAGTKYKFQKKYFGPFEEPVRRVLVR